jgi:hypothetical protein
MKTWVVSYELGPRATLYTLNEQLEDADKPTSIGSFDATQGFGYAFPDNALAIFGRTDNAAVEWVDNLRKSSSVATFPARYNSFLVNDALPISPDQFVAVRASVSTERENRVLILSWLTLK